MVPLTRTNQKPVWPWFIYMLIAFLLVTLSLIWINPTVPKSIIYGVFRELAQTEMAFKTWNWDKISSQHFIIKYRPQDKNIAKMVLQNAEQNLKPVSGNLGYFPKQKIQVVIYPTRESLSKSFGWDANESAMGVYWAGVIRILSPNEWISTDNQDTMATIFAAKGPMAHEYTHLVVDYLTRGNYPRWFTEGVAQYNEYLITGFKLPNENDSIEKTLYLLKDMDDNFDNLPDQALAYRESLVAVKYIVQKYGQPKLKEIINDLGKGYSMDRAMKHSLGVGIDKFESQFNQWVDGHLYEMN